MQTRRNRETEILNPIVLIICETMKIKQEKHTPRLAKGSPPPERPPSPTFPDDPNPNPMPVQPTPAPEPNPNQPPDIVDPEPPSTDWENPDGIRTW